MFTAKPLVISAMNPYTCTIGMSINMQMIAPKPHTMYMKTNSGANMNINND